MTALAAAWGRTDTMEANVGFPCRVCDSYFLTAKELKKHEDREHQIDGKTHPVYVFIKRIIWLLKG